MKRFFIAVLLCALSVATFAQSKNFKLGKWVEIQNAILKELDKSYVDTLPVDRMERAAIDAMLSSLDPYTVYVPEEENEDFKMMVGKVYGGIGAIIYKPEKEGNVIINEPYENSPAVKAGLRCCDEIVSIDGVSTHGLDSGECSERMKGQPGTKVNFTVIKAHSRDTVEIAVTREKIHLPDIEYAAMLDATTGYIYQSGFTEGVAFELANSIRTLKAKGMKTLVYDLRGNGGGMLKEAVDIVSLFVPKGSVAVSSVGRVSENNFVYKTRFNPIADGLKVLVLVDGGSASASEIVSGALQDYDRATIMGTRTFGKGLVQSIKPLPYGGQLKVTTAKYYTPSGRCVQAIDYAKRDKDGSVQHIPDSLTHEFHTASGRPVRDGGGITPDIEIPLPQYPDIVYQLVMGQVVERYVLDYVRKHETIPSADEFVFDDLDGFKEFASTLLKDPKVLDELELEHIAPIIEEEIVVRYYFQREGVRVRLRNDKQLKQALEVPQSKWI